MSENYLDELNEAQREAVLHTDGPVLIVAGAGSGKTRVLTYRIVHLLKHGVEPSNILSLTFTNKAAGEMKERIERLVGPKARYLWMGTFHSVFAKILRFEGHLLGYPSNFTIYDTEDSRNLIKTIVKELKLDEKIYKPNMVHSRISLLKNNLISPQDYLNNHEWIEADRYAQRPEFAKIFKIYNERLFRSSAMDFDDLLYNTNVLMRDFPEILVKYQDRFRYIMVDEYQDTNYSQYIIVKKLAQRFENICVVGDDSQSIYSFRGADITNILNFKKDFPDYTMFKLELNYRSTKNIVEAANSLIRHNKQRLEKKIYTINEAGEKITVHCCQTDIEEGQFVANEIYRRYVNGQGDYKDFAVLYRTNAQSRIIEEHLRRKNIPYRLFGSISFYQRKEIKDLLAYFRLTVNPNDEEALKRVINYPARGIGDTTVNKLIEKAATLQISLWQAILNAPQLNANLHSGTLKKLQEFREMIEFFSSQLYEKSAFELGELIMRHSGIYNELNRDKTPEGVSRYENIMELLNGLKEFTLREATENNLPTLEDYLQEISLLTDADDEEKQNMNAVSLMTIHMSKGLEFDHVFVVGLEDGLFPNFSAMHDPKELEEERRLLYVAITRAEKKCYLTYALNRFRFGQNIYSSASPFIDEMDESYLEFSGAIYDRIQRRNYQNKTYQGNYGHQHKTSTIKDAGNKAPKTEVSSPPKTQKLVSVNSIKPDSNHTPLYDLKTGEWVEHEKFGIGEVKNIDGQVPNIKATIDFKNAGQKVILVKFARLKRVN